MSNPSGPDQRITTERRQSHRRPITAADRDRPEHEPATEILLSPGRIGGCRDETVDAALGAPLHRAVRLRRGQTQIINTMAEPATEVSPLDAPAGDGGSHRTDRIRHPLRHNSFRGAATRPSPRAAAQLGLGDRGDPGHSGVRRGRHLRHGAVDPRLTPAVSQQDMVRTTIQNFDTAIQKGDLATLRSITCGETGDSYVKYDDRQWNDIHARVAAAGSTRWWPASTRSSSTTPRGGQRDDVHGLRSIDPLDAQLRPGVPRRAVEDLPGPRLIAVSCAQTFAERGFRAQIASSR